MDEPHVFDKYIRGEILPHVWCPGCGNGIVLQSIVRAIEYTGIEENGIVVVSGIGCSSRAVGYLNLFGIQTNHGRAIACATGIKMMNPQLNVIVLTGDGDCCSIGANHFIHAARRNIDLTVVVFNNFNYGMTGGQYSACTPTGSYTKTSTYGSIEEAIDICGLASEAGGTYVARSGTLYPAELSRLICNGILHKGFSVIDAITDCPSLYGRLNGYYSPAEMMKRQESLFSNKNTAKEKITLKRGVFINRNDRPEYTENYYKLIQSAQEKTGEKAHG